MNSITKLELKKIISNKSVMIACFLVIIYILVALYGSIITEEYTKLKNNDSTIVDIKGLEAIKLQRQDEHKIAEYLSEDKLSSIINYYHELKSDKNNIDSKGQLTGIAYFKYWDCYSNIQSLIAESYSDINFINYDIIKQLTANDAKEFYSNRIKKLKVYLDHERVFDEKDKKEVIKSANKLSTPLDYDYTYGWERIFDNIIFLNILLIIIICFCISRVFTKEYKSEMIMVILPTVNGKRRLASSKVIASIIFSTITYLIVNALFFILFMSVYGYDGWNIAIQIESMYWLSIYNIKFYQAYLLGLGTGYCCCMFMIMMTLWLSIILKKAFLTFSISITILLIPSFINTKYLYKDIAKWIEVLPIKAINFTYNLKQPYFFTFFGKNILRAYITPIILLILSCTFIPFIIKRFNKQQV